jgi:hypothetical protein
MLFCAPLVARADDASDRAAADRLAAIVHDQAQIDGSTRTGVIAGLIIGGSVATAIGVPLMVDGLSRPSPWTTDDQVEIIGGVLLTTFGGTVLLSWPLALLHTPTERLDARMHALATLAPNERLTRMEAALETASAEERRGRKSSAILAFVAGAINAGIVPLEVATGNHALAFVNGLAAVFAIVSGSIQLVSPGPLERLWRTWRVGTGRSTAIRWTPILSPTHAGFALSF